MVKIELILQNKNFDDFEAKIRGVIESVLKQRLVSLFPPDKVK